MSSIEELSKSLSELGESIERLLKERDAIRAECRVLAAECRAHRGSSGIKVYHAKQATDAAGLLEKYK